MAWQDMPDISKFQEEIINISDADDLPQGFLANMLKMDVLSKHSELKKCCDSKTGYPGTCSSNYK